MVPTMLRRSAAREQGLSLVNTDGDGAELPNPFLASRRGWSLEPSPAPDAPPSRWVEVHGRVEMAVIYGSVGGYLAKLDRDVPPADRGAAIDWIQTNERVLEHP